MQRNPFAVRGKPRTLQQLFWKLHRGQRSMPRSHLQHPSTEPFQHELLVPNTLIRHLFSISFHLHHSILPTGHLRMKHLLHARCTPHHISEVWYFCFKKKHVHTVIAQKQRSVQEQIPSVPLIQLGCFAKIRRNWKLFYPLFIHTMNANFFSITSDPFRPVWVQSVIKAAWNISTRRPLCSIRFDDFVYFVYYLHFLAVVFPAQERRMRCVRKTDAPFGNVRLSLRGGQRRDESRSISSSSMINQLTFVIHSRFQVLGAVSIRLSSYCFYG